MKSRMMNWFERVRWYVRQVSGDAAYENYLRHVKAGTYARGHSGAPLSREQFYLDALRRRYSGVSRCC